MTTQVPEAPMAKRTGNPERVDTAVKLDAEVVRKAKIVAAYRGQTLADYLSESLGSFVDRDMETEHSKETSARAKAPKNKRGV